MARTKEKCMGRVLVDIELTNKHDMVKAAAGVIPVEQIRRTRVQAIVDTGATHLVLPKAVSTQLGLSTLGKTLVRYADNRRAPRTVVEDVQVELLGRRGTFRAIVEPKRTDVLLGAIVLEDLDLLVDCLTQTLQPRDPRGIVAIIE